MVFSARDGRRIVARSFGAAPDLTPTGIITARISTELGAVLYDGPFAGLRPEGDGRCKVAGQRDAPTEPCSFVAGIRTDEPFLALLDAKRAADALAAQRRNEQVQQDRLAYAAEQQRQRDVAAADERRENLRMQEIRRDRAAGQAAIAGAFESLGSSFAQAQRDLSASQAEVNRINSGGSTSSSAPRISQFNSPEAEAIYRASPAAIAQPPRSTASGQGGAGSRESNGERSNAEFREIREQLARELAAIERSQALAVASAAQAQAQVAAERAQITAAREAQERADSAQSASPSAAPGQGKPLDLYLTVRREPTPAPSTAVPVTTTSSAPAPKPAPKTTPSEPYCDSKYCAAPR
jgi:hypothetical protein